MLFLHGILGRGQNWRSHARRLVDARPDWAAVLVDLRLHGASLDAPAPHTLAACVRDLRALPVELPLRGAVGHSFGGKVALALAAATQLDELWVIDSSPSARPDRRGSEDVGQVFAALRAVPVASSRAAFVASMKERGFSEPLARWLAMSLREDAQGWRPIFDLDAIDAMLDDYFAADLWPALTRPARVEVVVGGRSAVLDADDRAQLAALAAEGVRTHVFDDAGHWLHVEAPERLAALLADAG